MIHGVTFTRNISSKEYICKKLYKERVVHDWDAHHVTLRLAPTEPDQLDNCIDFCIILLVVKFLERTFILQRSSAKYCVIIIFLCVYVISANSTTWFIQPQNKKIIFSFCPVDGNNVALRAPVFSANDPGVWNGRMPRRSSPSTC